MLGVFLHNRKKIVCEFNLIKSLLESNKIFIIKSNNTVVNYFVNALETLITSKQISGLSDYVQGQKKQNQTFARHITTQKAKKLQIVRMDIKRVP